LPELNCLNKVDGETSFEVWKFKGRQAYFQQFRFYKCYYLTPQCCFVVIFLYYSVIVKEYRYWLRVNGFVLSILGIWV